VSVDVRRAVIPGLQTGTHILQNNHRLGRRMTRGGRSPNFFRTKDGRVIYLLRGAGGADKLIRLLDLLNCSSDDASVSKTVASWQAKDLEDAIAEKKLIAVMARTKAEWLAHPQGKWLADRPVIDIEKVADSSPEPFKPAGRPLSGIRILDMTHVLAGPVTTRTLAEQGADVLHVSAPYQSDSLGMTLDTGFGKRSAYIDLNEKKDVDRLMMLIQGADIFVQSWRPGVLDAYGLSPQNLVKLRPGLIYVSVSCYGSGGPWANRGGYEPLGQTACGLAVDEGSIDAPLLQPTGTMNDYLVPYLGAGGTLGALIHRSKNGGSYHVKVSLTRASMWLQELGPLSTETPDIAFPRLADDSPDFGRFGTPFGEIRYSLPITQYSETKAYWDKPPVPPGAHQPEWI